MHYLAILKNSKKIISLFHKGLCRFLKFFPPIFAPSAQVRAYTEGALCILWKIEFFNCLGSIKMVTKAQIIANRRNAKKSTGPRTPQGKDIVSQNAVKHGLTANRTVIKTESQADFDLHRSRIIEELAPSSPMASMLTERIVDLSWRLKRTKNIQNQTIDALTTSETSGPLARLTRSLLNKSSASSQTEPSVSASELTLGRLAIKDFANTRVLERLLMYERRIENSLYKTILEIQRLNIIKKLDSENL
jgi:hypothetical protein